MWRQRSRQPEPDSQSWTFDWIDSCMPWDCVRFIRRTFCPRSRKDANRDCWTRFKLCCSEEEPTQPEAEEDEEAAGCICPLSRKNANSVNIDVNVCGPSRESHGQFCFGRWKRSYAARRSQSFNGSTSHLLPSFAQDFSFGSDNISQRCLNPLALQTDRDREIDRIKYLSLSTRNMISNSSNTDDSDSIVFFQGCCGYATFSPNCCTGHPYLSRCQSLSESLLSSKRDYDIVFFQGKCGYASFDSNCCRLLETMHYNMRPSSSRSETDAERSWVSSPTWSAKICPDVTNLNTPNEDNDRETVVPILKYQISSKSLPAILIMSCEDDDVDGVPRKAHCNTKRPKTESSCNKSTLSPRRRQASRKNNVFMDKVQKLKTDSNLGKIGRNTKRDNFVTKKTVEKAKSTNKLSDKTISKKSKSKKGAGQKSCVTSTDVISLNEVHTMAAEISYKAINAAIVECENIVNTESCLSIAGAAAVDNQDELMYLHLTVSPTFEYDFSKFPEFLVPQFTSLNTKGGDIEDTAVTVLEEAALVENSLRNEGDRTKTNKQDADNKSVTIQFDSEQLKLVSDQNKLECDNGKPTHDQRKADSTHPDQDLAVTPPDSLHDQPLVPINNKCKNDKSENNNSENKKKKNCTHVTADHDNIVLATLNSQLTHKPKKGNTSLSKNSIYHDKEKKPISQSRNYRTPNVQRKQLFEEKLPSKVYDKKTINISEHLADNGVTKCDTLETAHKNKKSENFTAARSTHNSAEVELFISKSEPTEQWREVNQVEVGTTVNNLKPGSYQHVMGDNDNVTKNTAYSSLNQRAQPHSKGEHVETRNKTSVLPDTQSQSPDIKSIRRNDKTFESKRTEYENQLTVNKENEDLLLTSRNSKCSGQNTNENKQLFVQDDKFYSEVTEHKAKTDEHSTKTPKQRNLNITSSLENVQVSTNTRQLPGGKHFSTVNAYDPCVDILVAESIVKAVNDLYCPVATHQNHESQSTLTVDCNKTSNTQTHCKRQEKVEKSFELQFRSNCSGDNGNTENNGRPLIGVQTTAFTKSATKDYEMKELQLKHNCSDDKVTTDKSIGDLEAGSIQTDEMSIDSLEMFMVSNGTSDNKSLTQGSEIMNASLVSTDNLLLLIHDSIKDSQMSQSSATLRHTPPSDLSPCTTHSSQINNTQQSCTVAVSQDRDFSGKADDIHRVSSPTRANLATCKQTGSHQGIDNCRENERDSGSRRHKDIVLSSIPLCSADICQSEDNLLSDCQSLKRVFGGFTSNCDGFSGDTTSENENGSLKLSDVSTVQTDTGHNDLTRYTESANSLTEEAERNTYDLFSPSHQCKSDNNQTILTLSLEDTKTSCEVVNLSKGGSSKNNSDKNPPRVHGYFTQYLYDGVESRETIVLSGGIKKVEAGKVSITCVKDDKCEQKILKNADILRVDNTDSNSETEVYSEQRKDTKDSVDYKTSCDVLSPCTHDRSDCSVTVAVLPETFVLNTAEKARPLINTPFHGSGINKEHCVDENRAFIREIGKNNKVHGDTSTDQALSTNKKPEPRRQSVQRSLSFDTAEASVSRQDKAENTDSSCVSDYVREYNELCKSSLETERRILRSVLDSVRGYYSPSSSPDQSLAAHTFCPDLTHEPHTEPYSDISEQSRDQYLTVGETCVTGNKITLTTDAIKLPLFRAITEETDEQLEHEGFERFSSRVTRIQRQPPVLGRRPFPRCGLQRQKHVQKSDFGDLKENAKKTKQGTGSLHTSNYRTFGSSSGVTASYVNEPVASKRKISVIKSKTQEPLETRLKQKKLKSINRQNLKQTGFCSVDSKKLKSSDASLDIIGPDRKFASDDIVVIQKRRNKQGGIVKEEKHLKTKRKVTDREETRKRYSTCILSASFNRDEDLSDDNTSLVLEDTRFQKYQAELASKQKGKRPKRVYSLQGDSDMSKKVVKAKSPSKVTYTLSGRRIVNHASVPSSTRKVKGKDSQSLEGPQKSRQSRPKVVRFSTDEPMTSQDVTEDNDRGDTNSRGRFVNDTVGNDMNELNRQDTREDGTDSRERYMDRDRGDSDEEEPLTSEEARILAVDLEARRTNRYETGLSDGEYITRLAEGKMSFMQDLKEWQKDYNLNAEDIEEEAKKILNGDFTNLYGDLPDEDQVEVAKKIRTMDKMTNDDLLNYLWI